MRLSSSAVAGAGGFANLRVTRYEYEDDYNSLLWSDSDITVWLEMSVTDAQAVSAADVNSKLFTAEPLIPLGVEVDPGDCTILQIVDLTMGRLGFDVGGLLSNVTQGAIAAVLNSTDDLDFSTGVTRSKDEVTGALDEVTNRAILTTKRILTTLTSQQSSPPSHKSNPPFS